VEDYLIDLTSPTGLRIDKLHVAVGDSIQVGQLLATVDISSVTAAISALNSELAALQEQLDALYANTTEMVGLTAKSTASVKAIYATEGAAAADVVAEHGALMVLELEGGGEMLITDSVGIISSLWVYEGWTVYDGTWLLSLEIPTATGNIEELEARRAELITELETLSVMVIEPYLYATQTGTISTLALAEGQTFDSADCVAAQLIAPDSAQLSLAVDELDIASVHEGQEVSIELEALEGQTFLGSVKEVSATGSVSGSVTTYPVTITFERSEAVLVGMSAAATIIKEEKDDALIIPLLALQEYGDRVYVYTGVDEQGNLGGETQVETGLSDGTDVEITSGLAEGTTIYYRQQSSSDTGGFGMGGMGMAAPGRMVAPSGADRLSSAPNSTPGAGPRLSNQGD
jgi:multidrug efflux pump subunit AcrA (membrane-fusion protein)